MQFPTLNRARKEWAFGNFRNVSGSTIAANVPVVLDVTTSDPGYGATLAASATLALFLGVTLDSAADDDYFRVQTYGYNPTVRVANSNAVTAAAGSSLVPTAGAAFLTVQTATPTGEFRVPAVILEAFATATTTQTASAAKKVFLFGL